VTLTLPEDAMLVLIGPSGAGKSTFAARHFLPSQVLSSDALRAMVADDPNDQRATEAAFELLHTALGLRLAGGRLTVVDATNVDGWARERLLAASRRHGRPAVALVFALPAEVCLERNARRDDRRLPDATIRRQHRSTLRSVDALAVEGFVATRVLRDQEEVAALRIETA
jgi:predicted kinase